ncbi:PepSY domain-containing protein [Streptomyces olivaceus]|uniref:PepSY domain-containing protein n=1 Tax=Streptomyces olivaceus TaxID=47716 RepID=UPI000878D542|nr:PepSY domain-containing protein [Streptomyces olivaceus]AOW89153.1 peptidase propeptide and YpeB domain protein [Streptomyces olivaceus]MBZ6199059.1 PepSY domain-containing protein [Streptomyces olivaceus]
MRRNIVIAAVTAAALIGGGTATALATAEDDGRGTAPRADVSVSDDGGVRDEADGRDGDRRNGPGASAAKVTAAEAIAAALRDTPGTAVSAELDDADDGDRDDDDRDDRRERAAWEVDVLSGDGTWHSVRVDPASGKVLGSHADADAEEEDDDAAEARAALKGASVTAAEAAQAAAGKGTVTSVDLDDDGGDGADRSKAAWEVETRASGQGERDWRVDLKTGEVTADRDDDGSHADDADDRDGSGSADADDSDDD